MKTANKNFKKITLVGVCAAFKQGFEVLEFLIKNSYDLTFVATCQKDSTIFESRIASLCNKADIRVFRKININSPHFLKVLERERIDLGILAWWPEIVKENTIASAKIGWVNLHPSYLPYGRGKHAYYWSIIEKTPFGATLHFIDEGVDTGPILFQTKIPISIYDTGESLYRKGVIEVIDLFKKNAKKIFSLQFGPRRQDEKAATCHHSREIEKHSEVVLGRSYKAIELIDILRGRTFNKGSSAFFFHNGKKYLIRANIKEVKSGRI